MTCPACPDLTCWLRIPAAAFAPMLSALATITALYADGSRHTATAAASVSEEGPLGLVGGAASARRVCIALPRASWPASLPIPPPRSTVAVDGRDPMTVQESYLLGEMIHLVCSDRETPPQW